MDAGPASHRLRERIVGDVVLPGDAGWDAARQAWNLVADQNPAAVVFAASADDIVATLGFAAEHGLRVAAQGTGHGATTLPDLRSTVLLRTSRLTKVEVDPSARLARAEAGALWRDVVPLAGTHGLAALHGSSGTVGVAGYTLGGGLGWLARSEGLACNSVTALTVVTAGGEARRVSAEQEPDLFWALRGGGGAYAVVTELEFDLVAVSNVYAGQLMWPMEQARAVVTAYRDWTADLPESVTSAVKLVRFPPLPQLPPPLRGRSLVVVALANRGDEAEGERLVAPLRAAAPPELDTLASMPATGLVDIAGDPQDPVPGLGGSVLLRDLPDGAVRAYLELAGPDVQSPLLHLELRHLGGALAESSPAHGAADRIDAAFLAYGIGMPTSPELTDVIGDALLTVRERFAPWASDRTFLNFAEQQPGTRASFSPSTAGRLNAVKAAYDPDGILVANHAVD
jgi:FAD binding domain